MARKEKKPVHQIKMLGWIPDKPDHRDLVWKLPKQKLMTLPPVVDLRSRVAQVFNQGNLGSCTANACAALVEFVDKADGSDAFWAPSRLFIYYNTRVIENTVSWDSGATIRDSIKSVVQWGFIPESVWPYDITKYKKK